MGWSYGWNSRKDLVAHLTRDSRSPSVDHLCLAKASVGYTNLWTLWEQTVRDAGGVATSQRTYIVLFLLRNGGENDGWGYKDVCASSGPCEVHCPLSWLDRVPSPAPDSFEADWMARVRQHHCQRGTGSGIRLSVGRVVPLRNCNIPEVEIVSARPLLGRTAGGTVYRIRRTQIAFDRMVA